VFSSSMATGPILARQIQEGIGALVANRQSGIESVLDRISRGSTKALLSADPPLHRRQRNLVNRAFTQRRVRESEDAIRSLAEGLVASFASAGEVEFVHQFAVPLPLSVIADRLGVPRQDMDRFKKWSDDFLVAIGNHKMSQDDLRSMLISQAEFFTYFEDMVHLRRAEPTADLVSELANARLDDGDELAMPELLVMINQFLVAGNETTTKLLTFSLRQLAADVELADRLRADPALIEPFVEEILRLEAPVQGLYRQALEDTELSGVPIPAGTSVWIAYASANHDGTVFPDPDDLDIQRQSPTPHLAFGFGEHFCLGAALARAEARIGITVLLENLRDIKLQDRNRYEFEPSYALHGLKELWLSFAAAGEDGEPPPG